MLKPRIISPNLAKNRRFWTPCPPFFSGRPKLLDPSSRLWLAPNPTLQVWAPEPEPRGRGGRLFADNEIARITKVKYFEKNLFFGRLPICHFLWETTPEFFQIPFATQLVGRHFFAAPDFHQKPDFCKTRFSPCPPAR